MNNINKVINIIKELKIDLDLISPNLVNDIAYENGISLTSEEIIYISDNI
jgi:hypothetical protein